MSRVQLATRLKVADPTALTALSTLRTRMGLSDRVAGLSREELFLFDIDAPAGPARELVEGVARRTNLFLNPNKHAFRLAVDGEAAPPRDAAGAPGTAAPPEAWLLVWTPGEGSELAASLERHAGVAGVRAVRRAWLWRFAAVPGIPATALLEAVRLAAVVRSRHEGFLVHPAFQEGRLFGTRPSVYDTWTALFAASESPAGSEPTKG